MGLYPSDKSSTGGGASYTAGSGINISGNNEISTDMTVVQGKLTAGSGINIDEHNNISATGGGGASVPTLTWHTGETGTTLTAAEISGKTLIKVYKNGMLLQSGSDNDYTISGTVITFETSLVATDKITTEAY